jgi:hypothetical protein
MSWSQRRRPSRRKRKALLAGLLSPVLLAGPINPAAAALMQYKFSGDFSKTPKKGFDWLVGARLEGNMLWDSKANNGNGAFTDWNVKSYRTDWQQQQEQIGSQTSPEIDSKIRGLQAKVSYIDNPDLLKKALENAGKELDKTNDEPMRKQIKDNIEDLSAFKANLDVSGEESQKLMKSQLQRQVFELNDSQISYLQARLNYIKNPELLGKARDNVIADLESASSKESTLQAELNGLPQGMDVPERTRAAVEQDLNSAQQIRAQAETSKAELDKLEKKLNDATDVELDSLKKALEGDLSLLSLQAKINYLDNPELLSKILDQAKVDHDKDPGNLALSSRFNYLETLSKEISENVSDPQSLKSELQLQLNELRAQQGFSGLSAQRPDPNEAPLIALTSDSSNSYCFASPVGSGSALGGGSFMQGAAGSSLCGGTNGGMMDKSFTEDQIKKKPVYFSVIQYFKSPETDQNVSIGFRLAFVPAGDKPGDQSGENLALLGMDRSESQPGYGATFRFGVQKGLEDGKAECGGIADGPEVVASNGGFTTACPFAPDEAGEVAGQPFLASLRLSSEIVERDETSGEYSSPKKPEYDNGDDNELACGHEDDRSPITQYRDGKGGEGGESGGNCRAQAPAPLPILGAGAAFAWSRRVRRRYGVVIPATVAAGR